MLDYPTVERPSSQAFTHLSFFTNGKFRAFKMASDDEKISEDINTDNATTNNETIKEAEVQIVDDNVGVISGSKDQITTPPYFSP